MSDVYRVRSVNPSANVAKKTWVQADSRFQAEQWVRQRYPNHIIKSALPRTPPEDAEVHNASERNGSSEKPDPVQDGGSR